jgi:rod shape-determining protein MreC
LKEENERLRKENVLLSFENASLREKAAENKRLKELIGFKEKSAFQLLPAKVISRQKRGFINDIVLAIGHADSVLKNMPVIVPAGLVGKLYQVGKTKSNCQLLLDQNFRVSAFDQRSRVAGIVKWTGSDYCWLSEVPKHADVIMGDSVITSGYGEIFPPGISIGQVISVNEAAPGLFVEIRLKPTVNFDKLEEVFVIKSLK